MIYVTYMTNSKVDHIKAFDSKTEARREFFQLCNSAWIHSVSVVESIGLKDIKEGQWTLLLAERHKDEFKMFKDDAGYKAHYQACDGFHTVKDVTERYNKLKKETTDNKVTVCRVIESSDYF